MLRRRRGAVLGDDRGGADDQRHSGETRQRAVAATELERQVLSGASRRARHPPPRAAEVAAGTRERRQHRHFKAPQGIA
jgi:hypothetical protein